MSPSLQYNSEDMYQCGKKNGDSLNPYCQGYMSFSGQAQTCVVTQHNEAWRKPEYIRANIVQTRKSCGAIGLALEALPFCEGLPSARRWTHPASFASHHLAQSKLGHCQEEEQLPTRPTCCIPGLLGSNAISYAEAEITSAVNWVGGRCCRWWFSRWHCSPRDCTETKLS